MRKYIYLQLLLLLCACGGGSGGGGHSITPAEKFFGEGLGTGQTPTHIIPREDGAGFEVLSFGAWGNVYDLTKSNQEYISFGYSTSVFLHNKGKVDLYDFLEQKKLDIQENYRFLGDETVANAVFVGPAIVYKYANYNIGYDNSDYGTLKLTVGQNVANSKAEFVMSNPANNFTTTDVKKYFTEDRKNVAVSCSNNGDVYVGYGTKQ